MPRKLETDEILRLSIEDFHKAEKLPLVLILDNLRSQSNIGSIFRTGDAFRVMELALCGITACPPSREMHKTALGATESLSWKYFDTTFDALQYYTARGFHVACLEQAEGSSLLGNTTFTGKEPWAVVIGNEVEGVNSEIVKLCSQAIEIPQFGTKHSLNVSIAAGILCWEFFQQRSFHALL
jgi:23S rRNA (guanosine2251-2'-O)-methyltransferase